MRLALRCLSAVTMAESYLNVMRHYKMIDGQASYAPAWHQGYQIAVLAPTTGIFVGNPDLQFEMLMPQGTLLGSIYNLYGDVVAELTAPKDGLVFGLRSRPSVLEGYAREAGFAGVEVLPIEGGFWRFYRLR